VSRGRWTLDSCFVVSLTFYFECKAASTVIGLGDATFATISFSAADWCSFQPRSSPDILERK
jgi:hypothetical protein